MNLKNSFNKIKTNITRIIKKDLIKVFTFNGFATVVKILVGIINAKIVAVLIGPMGIALVGQLQDFKKLYITFANGAIGQGVVKYIAEHKESENKTKLIMSNALLITLVMSCSMAIILIVFSEDMSRIQKLHIIIGDIIFS